MLTERLEELSELFVTDMDCDELEADDSELLVIETDRDEEYCELAELWLDLVTDPLRLDELFVTEID